jgi:hypothetical protein
MYLGLNKLYEFDKNQTAILFKVKYIKILLINQ